MPLPNRRKNASLGAPQGPGRSRGALLGLAVGDALGTTLEGRRTFAPLFPQLATGTHVDMRGRGPHELKAGQVTDSTQMATCLATSLRELTVFNLEDVRKRYVKWMDAAFTVDPYLREVLTTEPWHQASRTVWHQSGRRASNNAALARAAPLGVFYSGKEHEDARIRTTLEECGITHFDPRCRLAGAALNQAISNVIQARGAPKPEEVMLAAETGLAIGSFQLAKLVPELVRETHDASKELREDLEMARAPDPALYGPDLHLLNRPDSVRVTFRLAFWELLHTTSFEQGMTDAVNRGGDSDKNGAVVGALLGAVYGEDGIPERWKTPVLSALERSPGAFRDRYHPNQLLQLTPR